VEAGFADSIYHDFGYCDYANVDIAELRLFSEVLILYTYIRSF